MIERLEEVLVMDNGYVRVYNDRVLFNGKTEGNYFRLSFTSANYGVCVICEYDDKIVLLENYRYALQSFMTETVKGMGMNDKTPLETISIEIEEEIGGVIEKIDELGLIKNDLMDAPIYCFVAKIKEFKEVKHEDTECIESINLKTLEEVKSLVLNDKIQDTVTLSLLAKYFLTK